MITSRLGVIMAQSRLVVSNSPSGAVETWQFRRMTSSPGVEPRTYGPWADVDLLPTSGQNSETYDMDRSTFKQGTSQRVRMADNALTSQLLQGDQLMDPTEKVWAVSGVGSSGPGSIAYSINRDVTFVADGDRKGAV